MAQPSIDYVPRDPAGSVLHGLVRDHFETFRAEATHLRDGDGLPRFVEDEFRGFLRCGFLAGGFARFRCACGVDRLVAFSCKGRGFCPSCGGRRMTERAAHLVDHVFPDVPVRQWVLSLPSRVRYLLAWDHDLCKGVVRVLLREVHRFLRARARERGVRDPRGGGVAIVQRFGGALNLNVHVHALVLDGVFARDADGHPRFHPAPDLTAADVADVLAAIVPAVRRLLARRGCSDDDGDGADGFAEATPLLAGLASASVQGVVALGRRPGGRPSRLGVAPEDAAAPTPRACRARWEAFDLHADLLVPAGHRERLERVCRYALRPPVTDDRIRIAADGQVVLALRHPWADGTTHLVLEPTAFLERLAVLVPRPRVNLVLYHGVLAPRAAWRRAIVPVPSVRTSHTAHEADVPSAPASAAPAPAAPGPPSPRARGWRWADLMRRAFTIDVLACPRCGGRLRLVALLDAGPVTHRILRHLGLPTEIPDPRPSRAPPLADWSS